MNHPRGVNEAFSAAFVDELARHGLRDAVLSPGSRSGPLALAFEREDAIRAVVHLDERSAAYLALGIARASRRPVAVLSTSGTAAANFLPAIVEARHSGVPLIVVTADRPPELRATGANQTIDQIKMYGDAVTWFAEAGTPEVSPDAPHYWRSLASRACGEALATAGPVHVNVPLREPLYPDASTDVFPHTIEGRAEGKPWLIASPSELVAGRAEIAGLADVLSGVDRGLVVAGGCEHNLEPLLGLAERLGWPVLAEPASGLRVPGTISSYDALLRVSSFAETHSPEVVIRVGKLSLGRPLARLLKGTRQLAFDPRGRWWDEHRTIERSVVGSLYATCAALEELLPPRAENDWLTSWREAETKARAAIDATIDSLDAISEPRIARDLAALVPGGSNLFAAASMPVRDLESFMAPRADIRVFANRGANGIDGCVATTLGIATASGQPTFALLGDLALLHDSNGFLTNDVTDATFVVVNNDGGGIFSFLEQAGTSSFDRVFGTPHGRNLEHLARLHGLEYTVLETSGALGSVLASSGDGGRLIEARTERADNVDQHQAIWAAVEAAL